ncbi:MAG: MazG family protein, partial [Actinobacteria bacterium]|nr:MazG family protein [Actinomycetota bacterium]
MAADRSARPISEARMPLLVVPLAAGDAPSLTVSEFDALSFRDLVIFEVPDHPLRSRLENAGVPTAAVEDGLEPEAHKHGSALVCDPRSSRLSALASAGAEVTAGAAASPDGLSAAHAAPVVRSAAAAFATLVTIMARLRSADGCPWDNEQTHETLKVHLLEEAHEVIEAIDLGEEGADLEEELGDVLLQVLFHARLAELEGRFDIAGVTCGIADKLVRRHPHVFGDASTSSAAEVVASWEAMKKTEKSRTGSFEGIAHGLPALLGAHKTQKRAAAVGFAAGDEEISERLSAALDRSGPDALGDALFWLVARG